MDTPYRPADHTREAEEEWARVNIREARRLERWMPEWRRRSLEGRNRFEAVNDTTDRVAGR